MNSQSRTLPARAVGDPVQDVEQSECKVDRRDGCGEHVAAVEAWNYHSGDCMNAIKGVFPIVFAFVLIGVSPTFGQEEKAVKRTIVLPDSLKGMTSPKVDEARRSKNTG